METTTVNAAAAGMGIVGILVLLLMIAIGLVSLVCWIMTLIKIFKSNVGLGILGIVCGIFAFIYGWVKTEEYKNKKVMIVWTAAILFSLLLNIVSAALGFGLGAMTSQRGGG
jgi:hypothetical protein